MRVKKLNQIKSEFSQKWIYAAGLMRDTLKTVFIPPEEDHYFVKQ